MKKICVTVIMLFIFFADISSINAMMIRPNSIDKVQRDNDITLYITLDRMSNEKAVSAVDGILEYDNDVFMLVSSSGLLNNWTELSNLTNNNIFSYGNLTYDSLITNSSQNIVKVFLKVRDDAIYGDTIVKINNPTATDEEGNGVLIEGGSQVIRVLSDVNTLSKLELSSGTINFDSNVLNYNLIVENDINSIIIDALLTDASSSFLDKYGSREVELSVGENKIELKIQAETGEIQTYTINVFRKEKVLSEDTDNSDNDNNIDNDTNTDNDTNIGDDNDSDNNNDFDNDTGNDNTSDNNSDDDKKNPSKNEKPVENNKPTEDDSSNDKDVNDKIKSNNNYLSYLKLSYGSIIFDRAISEYYITIPYDVDKINIDSKTEDTKSSITIDGNEDLKVGENIITITVTAEDGNKRVYKINVTKKEEDIVLSSNSKLKKLTIKGYNIDFESNKLNYNIKIKNEDFLNITYIRDDEKSNVSIIGNKDLKDGSIITVSVVAEDGSITSYTINIQKETNNKFFLLSIIIFLILLLILLLIFIILKKKKEQKNSESFL